jgi:hypothetical protein
MRGLSYDLAVLQANYIIDRGLYGEAAMRAFQDESADLIESVRTFCREGSKRLGLAYARQEKEGVDPTELFRDVGEDLRNLASGRQNSAPESASPRALNTGTRRGRPPDPKRRDAIRTTMSTYGAHWRGHLNDIFAELDSREVGLGDFQNLKIDLGDGERAPVST